MFSLPLEATQSLSAVLLVPVIVAIFAALFIGGLMVPGAKPEAVGKAIACYILKAVGVILLIIGAMQLLFSLLILTMPETSTLLVLGFLLVVGIGILVQASRVVARLDDASTVVPRMVFAYSCIVIGTLAALSGLLSYIVNFIMTQQVEAWQSTATIVVSGTVLAYFSSLYVGGKNGKAVRKKK